MVKSFINLIHLNKLYENLSLNKYFKTYKYNNKYISKKNKILNITPKE